MIQNRVIYIKSAISADLALRNRADSFFDLLEKYQESQLTLDFTDVRSISRSFAHQYLVRKAASKKMIKEVRKPDHVEKMFNVVKNATTKSQLLNPDSMPLMTV